MLELEHIQKSFDGVPVMPCSPISMSTKILPTA